MVNAWYFQKSNYGRIRESQVEKFFASDAVEDRSDAIVREGIQNSLDAAPDGQLLRVRIRLGTWNKKTVQARWAVYGNGFDEHFQASLPKFRDKPTLTDTFRFLVFEDFGTSGLLGNPLQCWPNDHESNSFLNYFRGEGVSAKEEGSRGRHGVGKFVFAGASLIRATFGLTRRSDGRELLMGTTVLHNHFLHGRHYTPDGWFGIPDKTTPDLTLPVEADREFIAQFKEDFHLSRTDENGLSVVVPFLDPDVKFEPIATAVIRGYYYPIMRRELVVEVIDERGKTVVVDADSLRSVARGLGGDFSRDIDPVLALAEASLRCTEWIELKAPPANTAPKWSRECASDKALEAIREKLQAAQDVAVEVPLRVRVKDKPEQRGTFRAYFRRDAEGDDRGVQFIREGIIIPGVEVRPRTAGLRGLVLVDAGPVATFLGDAENPSHTRWEHDLVKNKYQYAKATRDYVIECIPRIMMLVGEEQKTPDPSLLIDLFSLPENEEPVPKGKAKKGIPAAEAAGESEAASARPKRFEILKSTKGFVVRRGDPSADRPTKLRIAAAYDVQNGNPLRKYDRLDFQFGKKGLIPTITGGRILQQDGNVLLVKITRDDFEIVADGFDENRDLYVEAKVAGEDGDDAQAS